jgi:hypothetical protein
MTTAATPITKPVSERPAPIAEHWWLLLVLVSVVAGFWPSFFNRLRAQDLSHSLHGFTATGWLLGLILQSWLIGQRERTWHRRVAMAMIPMAIAMIVTAVPMIQAILRTGQQQPGFQPIARMLVMYDVSTLLLFTGLLSLALVNVRQPAVHRRALSATALVAIQIPEDKAGALLQRPAGRPRFYRCPARQLCPRVSDPRVADLRRPSPRSPRPGVPGDPRRDYWHRAVDGAGFDHGGVDHLYGHADPPLTDARLPTRLTTNRQQCQAGHAACPRDLRPALAPPLVPPRRTATQWGWR